MFDPEAHPTLMTARQVAVALDVDRARVRYLLEHGKLRYRRVGHNYAIPAQAVREFLDGTDHPAASTEATR